MANALRVLCSAFKRARRVIGNVLGTARQMILPHWQAFWNWIIQPHVRRRLLISLGLGAAILVLLPTGIAAFGFGPIGIVAGSLAAGIQSMFYGGFVPAGGWFAVLTSAGMTGVLAEFVAIPAAIVAALSAAFLFAQGYEN